MKTQRRNFLKQSSLLAGALTIVPEISMSGIQEEIGQEMILRKLTKLNDEAIEKQLKLQLNEPGHRWDGGVYNAADIPNAHSTYSFITILGNSYACKYSKYYLSERLEQPMERAAWCLQRVQHEDGTIDLHSTLIGRSAVRDGWAVAGFDPRWNGWTRC